MSIWPELIAYARKAHIPAPGLRAVTLAQWILESGRGISDLAQIHYNFAGLKYRPEMAGYATPVPYVANDGPDTYCAFASCQHFILGYWRFISRSPYAGWEAYRDDPQGYITFLHSKGYATDPNYVAKVMAVLDEAKALLGDASPIGEPTVNEPDRPNRSELGQTIDDYLDPSEQPDFVTLQEVQHVFHSNRPNGLEGAIVHYDAGRIRPGSGGEDLEFGAKSSLQHSVKNRFAYATISRSGKIYLPGNMSWTKWGSHAGESRCPITKRESVSRFLVGFEVNSPGLVYPTADSDTFVPWFNAVSETIILNGKETRRTIFDSKGRAKVLNPKGELYKRDELRIIAHQNANIRPGAYVPYTAAQFKSLVNVILWLKRNHTSTFRLDYVFGHDEVSPGRKVDPGGALGIPTQTGIGEAMTMPQFRNLLLKAWADQQGLVGV